MTARPWHAADRGIGWEVHCGPQTTPCWSRGARCGSISDGFRDTLERKDAEAIASLANVADELIAVARVAETVVAFPVVPVSRLYALKDAVDALNAKLAEIWRPA